ncbi:MAG: Lrp/AsnC ligand binding domain-containing protein [Candidatus Tectomicrobia bacterium]|uniref:Lrp/AsnC ligand binding domain-containing protein n=1 Tax=Tectimicrobiota bacterium TaxID=2528274 RepID=A0A933LRU0_UNCTE|nr:Lrp/AsnC ligand binding domain-containing protein [Candidatus Tectomicrobia bacterium]
MKAYMFLKFKQGADLEQARHAIKEPGVESIDFIMGLHDAIATVQVPDMAALGKLATRIRNCPGLQDSITCPVIS